MPKPRLLISVLCSAVALAGGAVCGQTPAEQDVLLRHFVERVEKSSPADVGPALIGDDLPLPEAFVPWWQEGLGAPVAPGAAAVPVDLDGLILSSLAHSPRIRYLSEARRMVQTSVDEAEGAFDWRAFMDSKYTSTNEPVGSLLTTGGASRYLSNDWTYAGGLRRRVASGGQFEVSQRIGTQDTNSIYFVPPEQGNAMLALTFSQPLLRGAGGMYNRRLIVLAAIDASAADSQFVRQAQSHLLTLTESYWNLYLARAALLQQRRLCQQAEQIRTELERRAQIDAMVTQILQARAAVAKRRTALLRTASTMQNMESHIRALVNDPKLTALGGVELVPHEAPTTAPYMIDMRTELRTALAHRPEIREALDEIRAARVKLDVSESDLLPALDLYLETYAKGLRGSYNVASSVGDQFSEGAPSYNVGLLLDLPLGNETARARNRRQQIELRRSVCKLADAAELALAEVEIAVREARTTYLEVASTCQAMLAKDEEVQCLENRWRTLAGDGGIGSVMLEQLLQAQEGLNAAEFAFVEAQVSYNLALTRLKQADGTLLQLTPCGPHGYWGERDPELLLQRQPSDEPVIVAPALGGAQGSTILIEEHEAEPASELPSAAPAPADAAAIPPSIRIPIAGTIGTDELQRTRPRAASAPSPLSAAAGVRRLPLVEAVRPAATGTGSATAHWR